MVGMKIEKKVDESSRQAVSSMGMVGEWSMKRLNTQLDAIMASLIREECRPNPVVLNWGGYRLGMKRSIVLKTGADTALNRIDIRIV